MRAANERAPHHSRRCHQRASVEAVRSGTSPPGSRPMPAPARRTCWRSASSSLLLRGDDPAKILCITFTKAAAANMATRVFSTLAALDSARRRRARRRRSATSSATSRSARTRARAAAVRAGAGNAGRAEGADHPRLLHAAAASVSVRGQCRRALRRAGRGNAERSCWRRSTLDVMLEGAPSRTRRSATRWRRRSAPPPTRPSRELIREAVAQARCQIAEWVSARARSTAPIAELVARARRRCRTTARSDRRAICLKRPIRRREWPDLAAVCRSGSKTDQGQADEFAHAQRVADATRLLLSFDLLHGKRRKPRKSHRHEAIRDAHPDWAQRLLDEQDSRLSSARMRRAAECRDRTRALLTVAARGDRRATARDKRRRGLLDYDDLIDRTLACCSSTHRRPGCSTSSISASITSLLDEAQDTSPKQWEIVRDAGRRIHRRRRRAQRRSARCSRSVTTSSRSSRSRARRRKSSAACATISESDFIGGRAGMARRQLLHLVPVRRASCSSAVDTVFGREIAIAACRRDRTKTVHRSLCRRAARQRRDLAARPCCRRQARDHRGWDAPFDTRERNQPAGAARASESRGMSRCGSERAASRAMC